MSLPVHVRLKSMASHRRRLEKGQQLFASGDAVSVLHLVEKGMVELVRHQEAGQALVLQRAAVGVLLAEASLYAGHYHCDAVAAEASVLVEIPKARIIAALRGDRVFADGWAAYLAVQVQAARLRAEILSLNTVAARLDGWLAWRGGALPPKGEWKAVAAEIGVSPEALYRELGKRRLRK